MSNEKVAISSLTAADCENFYRGALELARRQARRGAPLEYVRLQWSALLPDVNDRPYFDADVRLDRFQLDILDSAFNPSITELFIKGCTKPGKGFAVALAANVWFDVFPESRIILTSDRIDHAHDVIFAEIAAQRQRMQRPGPGRLQARGLADTPKHYITIANPKTGEGFSGQHGPRTLFIFDEASAITEDFYENARKQARLIIALSNPRTLGGWFRRAFGNHSPDANHTAETTFGRRRCLTVGGADCLNVRLRRLEKPIAPAADFLVAGRSFNQGESIPRELQECVRLIIPDQLDYARYGDIMTHADPRHRAVFGEGRFPTEDVELQLIVGRWLERHEEAWRGAQGTLPVEAFGLDVAASLEGDATVLAAGSQQGLRQLHVSRKSDTMQTVAWTMTTARECYGIDLSGGTAPIAVDMDGLGKGVGDRLAELGADVIPIRGNAAAEMERGLYANKRAEIFGELSRRLDPQGPWSDEPWPLVPDSLLREELAAIERVYTSDGLRFRLTPKDRAPGSSFRGDTLREKLGRSTDRADAIAYLYAAIRSLEQRGPVLVSRPLLLVTPEEELRLDDDLDDENADENGAWFPFDDPE